MKTAAERYAEAMDRLDDKFADVFRSACPRNRARAMKCVACGDHPLNYIHCDRWDCPLLMVRAAIEAGGWPFNRMPEDEDGRDPAAREEDDEHPDQDDPA